MPRRTKPKTVEPNGKDADRRKAILRAAVEVFAKKGYHGCRIADVAREAGVAYGLVYHYFQNKDELLRSVFDQAWTHFVAQLREATGADQPLPEKVRAIAHLTFDAYAADPRAVKVLVLEIGRSPVGGKVEVGRAFADVIRMVTQMFVQAQERGELREGADPLLASATLFGTLELTLSVFLVGLMDRKAPQALERAADQVAETFLRGVLPAPAEASSTWKTDRSSSESQTAKRG